MKSNTAIGLALIGVAAAVALSGWVTVAGTILGVAVCCLQK